MVSELTVPALIAARSLSDEIELGVGTGLKPRIVLNRLASRMFGPAPSMAEAERALQRKAEGGISSDWEAAAASANLAGRSPCTGPSRRSSRTCRRSSSAWRPSRPGPRAQSAHAGKNSRAA